MRFLKNFFESIKFKIILLFFQLQSLIYKLNFLFFFFIFSLYIFLVAFYIVFGICDLLDFSLPTKVIVFPNNIDEFEVFIRSNKQTLIDINQSLTLIQEHICKNHQFNASSIFVHLDFIEYQLVELDFIYNYILIPFYNTNRVIYLLHISIIGHDKNMENLYLANLELMKNINIIMGFKKTKLGLEFGCLID